TEIEYRLAWARTYMKKYGLLENSGRGVWAIAASKTHIQEINPREIVRYVRNLDRKQKDTQQRQDEQEIIEAPEEIQSWRATLHALLTKQLDPSAFERLVKRMLRESGFVQVEVTGRTGDGGIDGKGIAKINGILSFRVVFQCKRYRGSVGASEIRDFRGAMQGRADKGLLITTGYFTREAVKEATRDGAIAIDIVDGEKLAEKLKELSLGVRIERVENVVIDEEWFKTI